MSSSRTQEESETTVNYDSGMTPVFPRERRVKALLATHGGYYLCLQILSVALASMDEHRKFDENLYH